MPLRLCRRLVAIPSQSLAALLPGAPLQAEVAEQDRRQQERDHRGRDRRALAERAAGDRALERQRRHEVRGVERAAARQHVDQLEIGEGEQHRERHHHRDDRREQRQRHEAEALPGRGAVERRRLVERRRDGLQPREQADGDERHAAPDVGGDDRRAARPRLAEEIDVGVDHAHLQSAPS